MGRLTATDLGLHVDEYDADQHYQKIRDRWWRTGPDLKSTDQ